MLARADTLLLLTDQPGLFTADPRSRPDAELIAEIRHIDDRGKGVSRRFGQYVGTGGWLLSWKLRASPVTVVWMW